MKKINSTPGYGTLHRELRERLVKAAHGTACPMGCGRTLDATAPKGTPSKAVLDHIIPKVLGGQSTEENARVICDACNSSRGANTAWTPDGSGLIYDIDTDPEFADWERKW